MLRVRKERTRLPLGSALAKGAFAQLVALLLISVL
jgi:hypothetical protein